MKILKYILIIVALGLVIFVVIEAQKGKKISPTPVVVDDKKPVELCFAKFGPVNERGFADRYTLRMSLDNDKSKVTGELKFLPAEKDSKVGTFLGTVTPVDKIMMARTIDAWWDSMAEGMTVKEELKITFGEGTANIGFAEMVDRGDGVYVYKDPKKILYNLSLSDVACTDITTRENIESYLRANISTLSPVKAVLGGTWYVISVVTDLAKKSGVVIYEDGHIQEKKNFSFIANEKGEVISLTIN